MAKGIYRIETTTAEEPAGRQRSSRHATVGFGDMAADGDETKSQNWKREDEGENENKNESESESEEKKPPRARSKRGLANTLPAVELRRSKRIRREITTGQDEQASKGRGKARAIKREVKAEYTSPRATPPVKVEENDNDDTSSTLGKASPSKRKRESKSNKTASDLRAKKLKSYTQFAAARQSPFPNFPRPTREECKLAHEILASLHGARTRPQAVTAPTSRSGCGDSASVLDALVRTILSQNTSDANSSRAKRSMDAVYGSSDAWARIVEGGAAKLAKTIESGGLAVVKSRVILDVLAQTRERHGAYSLDHLFLLPDDEAMRELITFKGVGPKTASCVLLFCLRRPSFAVDTHVHRIAGLLGWRPPSATRDQTHAHLDARIPDEDKYGLHVLMVEHGKRCGECRAGGKNLGRCELRKAFRKGVIMGTAGEEVGEEVVRQIKTEDDHDGAVKELEDGVE
ncbi:DNA glycosylase [Nemania serpens]|nr:DNA glycosylase [Nemania serpens]